jgi:hypothetical protein
MGRERGPETGREPGPTGGGKGVGGDGDNTNRERGIMRAIPQPITDVQAGTLSDPREKQDIFQPPSRLSFLDFIPGVGTIRRLAGVIGPLNNQKFFEDKVVPSLLDKGLKVPTFENYMKNRMAGNIDAYGNPINDDDDDNNIILPVDTTFAQAPSDTDQEPSEDEKQLEGLRLAFRADGGRIGAQEGGIMNADVVGGEFDFESARQMYGLGKLVKKVTKTVKKIAKSPVGKAAILAATYKLGGGKLLGGEGFKFSNLPGLGFLKPASAASIGSVANFAGDRLAFNAARTAAGTSGGLGIGTLIAGTSIAAGLLTAEQEEEAQELSRGEGIDIEAARRSILARARAKTRDDYKMDFRARGFRAEGGPAEGKEQVAKKTMPLLDMGGKEMDLREEGGFVPIGRMEKADDVPARLSKNEFVFTADAVRNAGDGNVDKGAEVMYNMMKNLEAGGEVSEESQGLEGARKMFQTSQRLEEVL